MAKFEAPGIKGWGFMTIWIFKKLRRFVWKISLESKALLSSDIFHTNLLSFLKIQTVIKISFFNMTGLGYKKNSDQEVF